MIDYELGDELVFPRDPERDVMDSDGYIWRYDGDKLYQLNGSYYDWTDLVRFYGPLRAVEKIVGDYNEGDVVRFADVVNLGSMYPGSRVEIVGAEQGVGEVELCSMGVYEYKGGKRKLSTTYHGYRLLNADKGYRVTHVRRDDA